MNVSAWTWGWFEPLRLQNQRPARKPPGPLVTWSELVRALAAP